MRGGVEDTRAQQVMEDLYSQHLCLTAVNREMGAREAGRGQLGRFLIGVS